MKKIILICSLSILLACVFIVPIALADWKPDASLWKSVDGSTATIPLTQAIADFFGQGDRAPFHYTTPWAYQNLCEDLPNINLIFVTVPAPEDFAIAQKAGVELEVIPVVREGLVFLNNTANPVDNLTAEELRKIYGGAITNWKEVGGPDERITAYQRDVRSGSQTVFLQTLMGDAPLTQPEKAIVIGTMGELVDQVAGYDNARNALGYTMYYYITHMYNAATIRVLRVDGVAPSAETIANGEYPLCTTYCAVLRKDTPADHPARRLVAWLLSPEGQRVAVKAGYAPLEPSAMSEAGGQLSYDGYEVFCEGSYAYTLKDGKATIVGHVDSEYGWQYWFDDRSDVWPPSNLLEDDSDDYKQNFKMVIPDRLGGYPVVAIGSVQDEGAFVEGPYTEVVMPEGIVSIGDDAFFACYSLRSVTIPSTVTYIGENAFTLCWDLTDVTIPASVTYIGEDAFSDCDMLFVQKGSYAEQYARDNDIPYTVTPNSNNNPATPARTSVMALTIDNLSTRSGPSTKYADTGSYKVKGERVRIISVAYDAGKVGWAQCEVTYKNKLRRVYTGLKRFDAGSFDLNAVPIENPSDKSAKVTTASKALYGPGDGYDTYGSSLTLTKGQTVIVITTENGYAQVEWTADNQINRAWVAVTALDK